MKSLNRRRFLQGAAVLAPFLGSGLDPFLAEAAQPVSEPEAGRTLFVGTQTSDGSKGIYAYHWDPSNGTLRLQGLAAATPMPTYLVLSPNRKVIYVANETDTFHGAKSGGVSSFQVGTRMDRDGKPSRSKLTLINSEVADGTGTTNVCIDHTGRVLLCANYGGGSASSFLVSADGHIGPATSHFQYAGHGPNHDRQEAPHVHRATASPGNKFALFNDLGLDVIHVYAMDAATAKLTPHDPAAWKAPAGSGPRALRFHPNGRWAYCVTEMGSSVIVLDWDENKGTLQSKQEVALIPPDFKGRSQASEIALDHAGRYAYAADRFYDGLYSFAVNQDNGTLGDMARVPCSGKVPRYITLDPTERWLLTADQDSNGIEIFARDPKTGRLSSHGTVVEQTKPQCLVFV